MTIAHMWVGALTTSGAKVVAKTTATSARLAVSASAAITSPTFFGPVSPGATDIAILSATGLSANTTYYYAIEEDSVVSTAVVGRFKTAPSGAASFTVAASSCALGVVTPGAFTRTSNHAVFDTIRGLNPLMFLHMGDLHYRDITTNNVTSFRTAYDDTLANSRQYALYRTIPTAYIYDDHDGPGPNGDGSSAAVPAMAQVYRERVPSYTVPAGNNPAYQSWEIGRVLFIMSDTRHSRVPGSTVLGSAQKAWLLNLLQTSSATALVWISPTPWMGLAADTWAGFTTERQEVADMFVDEGWADRMVCISGDYHGLAMDTGAGNSWGGFPVAIFGSMDSVTEGNGTPTNQYDKGPTSIGPNRYGTISVVDNGDLLSLTMTGFIGGTAWNTHTIHVQTGTTPGVPPRELSLTYDETLSRVRITSSEIAGSPNAYVELADTFTRSTSNGWGNATSGQAWANSGGSAANYSVTGTVGRVTSTDTAVRRYTTSAQVYNDVELLGSVDCAAAPTGANIIGGFTARKVDDNNFYVAWISFSTTGALTFQIQKRVATTFTSLASVVLADTHTPGTAMRIRFRVVGDALSAKAWKVGDLEPADWQLVASGDAALAAAGAVGTHTIRLTSNTNANAIVDYDNVQSIPPPPITIDIERSANEISWSPVRGGVGKSVNAGASLTVDDYEFIGDAANHYRVRVFNADEDFVSEQTGVITPGLSSIWIKSIQRPFLNRPVAVVDFGTVQRAARNGVFQVKGRSFPVVVTDVRGSKAYDLTVLTDTEAQAQDFDLVLSSGDPVFVHVPTNCPIPVPGGYYVIGDTAVDRPGRLSPVRLFQLPMIACAAPGPGIVGATITWAGVAGAYATWDDLLAAEEAWADVLELIGSAEDVIVG